jgi:hypothetical protein
MNVSDNFSEFPITDLSAEDKEVTSYDQNASRKSRG